MMMKPIIIGALAAIFATPLQAQKLGDIFKKSKGDSTKKIAINDILQNAGFKKTDSLSTNDVAAGLKEALEVGTKKGTEKLSKLDGFFANAAIKILLPPEAEQVEKTLRGMGFGKLVDDAILSMNRAAEDAAKSATPIFVDAIRSITIQDAFGILRGSDTAATGYLRSKTLPPLTAAFRPIIENSLQKVDATKNWSKLITTYNKLSIKKINPDLAAFVTDKATAGIFFQVAEEEKSIRKDPAARVTDLLKKVFDKQGAAK